MRIYLFRYQRVVWLVIACVLSLFLFARSQYARSAWEGDIFALKNVEMESSLQDRCQALFEHGVPETKFEKNSEKYIISRIKLLRLYSQCYLRKQVQPKSNLDLASIERNLFPMLNFSPTKQLRENSGRGIIMTLGRYGTLDIQKLLAVLKLLGNTLPIEVFLTGDVSQDQVKSLHLSDQNVTFVDALPLIPQEMRVRWKRFANKWASILLTSFSEFIYMDTDIVPFVNMEQLFESSQYRETGSYFFHDRAIHTRMRDGERNFYRRLLPTIEENILFDIEVQNATQITGLKHNMESGVMLLNRNRYLPGLLVAATMQFWERTTAPVWGDKELFWMGQLISGESGFRFGAHHAAAIGELEEETDPHTNQITSQRVCSVQIAHLSDDFAPLWMNGGMRRCKLGSWQKDWKSSSYLRSKYNSVEEMQTHFLSGTYANSILLPSNSETTWLERLRNIPGGFMMNTTRGCSGYVWCAYNTPRYPGTTIKFNRTQQELFDNLSNAWWLN